MDDQARIPAPNYTQIPNAIFDLMADKSAGLTEAELRVILAIARKTFGWHKKRDKISLSQLEQLTSMSRVSIVAGIKSAIKRGIVRQTPDASDKRGGVFYELVVEDIDQSSSLTSTKSEPVQNLNQLNNYTKTSTNSELELVQNLNTQKKEKEKKESGRRDTARTPAVQAYFETYPTQTLDADQVEEINRVVVDIPKWQDVLRYWKMSGYRAQSIPKMLDRYLSGATVAGDRPGGNARAVAAPHVPVYELPTDTRPELSADQRRAIMARRKDI